MEGLAYVEVQFNDSDKKAFKDIVNALCTEGDFYHSDTISRINGDVTDKLHLTLYYGLVDQQIEQKALHEHLATLSIDTIKLGKIFLKTGYKSMYQSLMIQVLDEDGKLAEISRSFNQFAHMDMGQEFKASITLAYLIPEYVLKDTPNYPTELQISKIRYSEDKE